MTTPETRSMTALNFRHLLASALLCSLMGISATVGAQGQSTVSGRETGAEQAQLAAELAERERVLQEQRGAQAAQAQSEALLKAEQQQEKALRAVEAAREQLQKRVQLQQDSSNTLEAQSRQEAREVQRALEQAHESLRQASREVSHVHRELQRQQVAERREDRRFEVHGSRDSGGRAFLGVILGRKNSEGVQVLGVSPDGPAERAGVQAGDLIVSIMGETLSDGQQSPSATLRKVMAGVEIDDELDLGLIREGKPVDLTVVAAARTPFSWHANSRLVSATDDDEVHVEVEKIEIPGIDLERLQEELGEAEVFIHRERFDIDNGKAASVFEFSSEDGFNILDINDLSDLGEDLLSGTGIWFGMPMTRGLRMTSMEAGLASYFSTETGVLVLSARDDNPLQLQAGDVILDIAGREVSSAADVMRALREQASGELVEINIMRQQQAVRLEVQVPENQLGITESLWLNELLSMTTPEG